MRQVIAALGLSAADVSFALSASLRAGLLLAIAWAGAALLRRRSAAARHQLWALGVTGALLVPLLAWVLPPVALAPGLALTPGSLQGAARGGESPTRTAIATAAPAAVGQAPRAPRQAEGPAGLALAGAAGGVVVALRCAGSHLAARRLARRATPARMAAWLHARREAAAALGQAGEVFLGPASAASGPLVTRDGDPEPRRARVG
jgi:hypothetical protein